jgi:tRNA (cmo5U34)-methyltransferase
MPDAREVFDAYADDYDAARRRLVPCADAMYEAAVRGMRLVGRPVRRVLDLGAGTGLFSRVVAEAFPEAELTLLDGAPAMLERAGQRGPGATLVLQDLRDPLPDGPWDLVVSSLAIHHLEHPEQRDLARRVHAALAPGGAFVNAEQVGAPSAGLEHDHLRRHEAQARAHGTDDAEWAAALERFRADRCATVEQLLRWHGEAGFAAVDVPWRDGRFAVLVALRA